MREVINPPGVTDAPKHGWSNAVKVRGPLLFVSGRRRTMIAATLWRSGSIRQIGWRWSENLSGVMFREILEASFSMSNSGSLG